MDKVGVTNHSSISSHPLPIQNCEEIEQGSFSKDGKTLWVWSRRNGLCVCKAPNYALSGWIDTDDQILVSSCELEYKGIKLFALLFKHQSESTVAILSQKSGHLIQTVSIRESLTCICAINETVLPGLFSTATLHHFNGAVCLGCQNGCVFVLDLSLNTLSEQSKTTISSPRRCIRVHVNTANIIGHINTATSNDQQLAVDLNSQYIIKGNIFHYTNSADQLLFEFEKASVTSLLHVRQLCSVLIGYSFGGFQIFSFYDNTILFTFPFSAKHHYPPVTHFTFQEPENDPKPYVYIWVARDGLPAFGKLGSSPTLSLYQFGFKQKLEDQGFTCYQDMEACIPRLEHLLWPDPYTTAKMLTCTTIERLVQSGDPDGSFMKSSAKTLSVDRTLAVFICQVIDDNTIRGLMTVFDLNQWYHSQMPTSARWTIGENNRKSCPFLSLYKLPNNDNDSPLLDTKITSQCLFNSPSPVPESHLWPESLSINLSLLTTSDINLCLYEGVQKQVINQMLLFGADILLDPERFIAMCYSVQLLESPSDNPLHDLLTIALHYKLRSVLMAITKSVQNPGCRLSVGSFIEWIKTKVTELTTEKSTMLESLTTSSGIVDQFILNGVCESQHQLSLLIDIIVEVHLNPSISLSEDEISEMYNPSFVYSEIYQTAHWYMENGLLPQILDIDPTPMCETAFVFPVAALKEKYSPLEQKRLQGRLAIDILINEITEEDKTISYPPENINCLLFSKLYPVTVTRHCLELYTLYDLSYNTDYKFVTSYGSLFNIPVDVMRLALSIWKVDHDTLDIHNAKLLSIHFPSIYELGIQSLVENELYSKAIQCLSLGNVTCPRLHLQALVYSGHVQKAFTILSMFEGSEEYQQLMENYVDYCLKSNFSNKLKQLQLNLEQLSHICSILKSHEREEAAIHLSLSLLLLHQCNIEAISLAREKGYQGGMLGHCLSFGSALLPPVKETMCSEELLEKIQSTTEAPVGPPMVLSSIMPKTNDHTFTSQTDIILAVTKKVAEARQIISDPVTPLRKNTRLNDSIISSPGLSTMPFTSSPLSFARRQPRTLRQTPLIHNSTKRPMTPRNTNTLDRSDTRMKQFLADMEGFRTRMTRLSSLPRVDHDSIAIQTPRPIIILDHTPNTTSILKPNIIDSTPIELTTSTSRRIRFKDDDGDDDNNSTSLGRKPLSINTPLPLSDDSDSFYSPQSTTEQVNKRPDVDDLAANVVIATDHEKEFNESFIAAAEDEDDPIVLMDSSQLTKLGEICKSPSNIVESFTHKETDGGSHVTTSHVTTTYSHVITTDTQLTRSSINRNVTDNAGSFTQSKVVIPPLRLTPLVERDRFESKKVSKVFSKKRSTSRQPEKEFQKHSGVMVNVKQNDEVKYMFSPPPAVAMVTPAKDVKSTSSSSSDFVFSPPLLRSANRGKNTAANTKTVSNEEEYTEIDLPSSSRPPKTHSSIRQSSQQKRLRQVKTTQSTPRRSERLLRSAKKI